MANARRRLQARAWAGGFLLLAVAVIFFAAEHGNGQANNNKVYGPYGPEGARLREQLWIVPGVDPKVPLRATLFRPSDDAAGHLTHSALIAPGPTRRPLVVINHGTDEATREAVALPVFYWLSKWFVDKGYVVLLPQRRGHGATGGELAEGGDTCANPQHLKAGVAAADDIEAALRYMAGQPFIDASRLVVVGVSTGGWASLALASRDVAGVRLVINFAGGRGGHAYGQPNKVCGVDRLIEAAGTFGRGSNVSTLWVYSENDSYFGPAVARAMVQAWRSNGGHATLRMLPPFGSEGHDIVAGRAGWDAWGPEVEAYLETYVSPLPRLSGGFELGR